VRLPLTNAEDLCPKQMGPDPLPKQTSTLFNLLDLIPQSPPPILYTRICARNGTRPHSCRILEYGIYTEQVICTLRFGVHRTYSSCKWHFGISMVAARVLSIVPWEYNCILELVRADHPLNSMAIPNLFSESGYSIVVVYGENLLNYSRHSSLPVGCGLKMPSRPVYTITPITQKMYGRLPSLAVYI
jgi:hypothetical protein